MIQTDLLPAAGTLGLAIGLVLSLVCYLSTNVSPGGMITPGWLALTLVEDYRRFAIIVATTLLTWGGSLLLRKVTILYGKRLFAAVVLLGVLLTTTIFLLVQNQVPLLFAYQTLGFVVPGLITYQLLRQPPRATAVATVAITGATYGVLISGVLAGLVPVI